MMKQIIFILLLFKFILPTYGQDNREMKLLRWTEDQANNWYAELPWLIGADYINADAINQIEMWSKNTYNHNEINNELGMAESLGFNTLRVYLSSMVYEHDLDGLKLRIDDFLSIAQSHGIKPMFVIFDDCWNPESSYGVQPDPKPGVHNSGWVQDPAKSLRNQSKNNCIFKDLCVLENFYNDIALLSINK